MSMNNIPKVLMITSQEIIDERNDGGKICSFRNYELLKGIFGEDNVTLIMYTNCKSANDENIYRVKSYEGVIDRTVNILSGRLFTSKDGEMFVVDYLMKNQVDILFLDRSLYGSLLKKIDSSKICCKKWVFVHNVEKEYFKNKLRKKGLIGKLICKKINSSEYETLQRVDCVLGLTQRDSEKIKGIYGKEINYIIPASFSDVYDEKKRANRDSSVIRLLFIGSNFGPNFDGVSWLVKEVMEEIPEITLTIVGKGFENAKTILERKNVRVIGSVESLEEFYYQDYIMIMPIFYGDGQKIKTAEAMMYGKIIIGTDEALEGYDIAEIEGNGIFRCNTKEEFRNTILKLNASNRISEYEKNVRINFENNYSTEGILDKLKPMLMQEWSGK